MKYRSDIDGLRAVAVSSVLLYHFGSRLFGGGYVGVDVFFVISGYLITGTIRKEIEAGTFSIIAFYERRARRILPALFAMLLATLVVSSIIFMPDQLRDLGSRIVAVALFSSNFLFWKQADYFAGPIELEPLIHTWSLAVEEQFYILFPIFLIIVARHGRRRYFVPMLTIALASFALSVALLPTAMQADFYLLPTRAWEFLLGALLTLRRGRSVTAWAAEVIAAAGLVTIVGSAILLTSDDPFPGMNALWPCLGAAAIIYVDSEHVTRVGRLLGTKPFVAVGLTSYSLYLVHWPIIVFVRYALLREPTAFETATMIFVSFALAALSWRYVERPFRNRHRFSRPSILKSATAATTMAIICGCALFITNGWPQRFSNDRFVTAATSPAHEGAKCFLDDENFANWQRDACFIARGAGPSILLWGDSHANHYRAGIEALGPSLGRSILLYASAGCLPILGMDVPGRPMCRVNNDHVFKIIRKYRIHTVILSAYWTHEMAARDIAVEALLPTLRRLRAIGVRVKIIGDNPDFPFAHPEYLAFRLRNRDHPDAPFYAAISNYDNVNNGLRALAGRSNFFNPMAVLCQQRRCLVAAQGNMIMADNAHLSAFGSRWVIARMGRFLRR